MRLLFFFIILIVPLFSFYAGEVTVQVDKTWEISANETITDMVLNGTFLLENDFQKILQMNVSKGAEFQTVDETTYVVFTADEFSGNKIIKATALVYAAYPLAIASNSPFEPGQINSTPLTQPDAAISSIAASLSSGKETELEVATALTDWTYRYIEYDLHYWGSPAPAAEVFSNPNAVCVGYAHLWISLLNSLGLETRFVSGYAFAEEWQSHAWAEVKLGDAWVPVDPTFREFGALDARHIASTYSKDQSGVYDSLVARGEGFAFISTVSVKTIEKEPFSEVLFVHSVLYDDDLKVVVYNPTNSYVAPTYALSFPEYILPKDTQILAIPPKESKTLIYHLSTGELEPGYAHSIPYHIIMQGTSLDDNHIIVKGTLEDPEPTEPHSIPTNNTEQCPLIAFSLFFLLALACFKSPST